MNQWWKCKRSSKKSTKAITLIELLIAIALTSISATAMATIFEVSLDAWRFGQEIASIEAVAPELVKLLSDTDSQGLVDAIGAPGQLWKKSVAPVRLFSEAEASAKDTETREIENKATNANTEYFFIKLPPVNFPYYKEGVLGSQAQSDLLIS